MNPADRRGASTAGRYDAYYFGADWRPTDTVATRVTYALARVEESEPETLQTGLGSTVDTDALDRLFDRDESAGGLVVLPLRGYDVHVYSNGQIVVLDRETLQPAAGASESGD